MSAPRRRTGEGSHDGFSDDARNCRNAKRQPRDLEAKPARAGAMGLSCPRHLHVCALRHLPDHCLDVAEFLRLGWPWGQDLARARQLCRAPGRRRLLHLALQQYHLAGALHAGGARGAVHRAVPEPDRHGHPHLQVAVLLSLRHPFCIYLFVL